MLTIWTVTNRI